jgi:hypothetical protein
MGTASSFCFFGSGLESVQGQPAVRQLEKKTTARWLNQPIQLSF